MRVAGAAGGEKGGGRGKKGRGRKRGEGREEKWERKKGQKWQGERDLTSSTGPGIYCSTYSAKIHLAANEIIVREIRGYNGHSEYL